MQKITAFAKWHSYAQKKAKQYPNLFFLMKVSVFNCALLLLSVQLFAAGRILGQDVATTNVSFGVEHETLKGTLKKLKDVSGYLIFYPSEKIEENKKVFDLVKRKRTVAETLKLILENTGLDYKQEGEKTIILYDAPDKKAPQDPSVTVSGTVLDENGTPLLGVTLRLKNHPKGVVFTDFKGQFIFTTEHLDDVLVFSYIGFKVKEIPVKNMKSSLTIVLQANVGSLDEVQVTAYGRTTKRLNTGDQTTITAKEIEKYPASNPLVALQGSVPGLFITQSSGTPGSTYSVNIRGQNSVTAGSDPFYVIDGIPYSGGSFSSQKGNTISPSNAVGYDALSFINPQDIESINVLKDADATAIYGSRAANGVILITTKKGKAGATRVDVNVFSGIRQMINKIELLNTPQYLAIRREALANDKLTPGATDYDLNGVWDTTRNTNFAKEFLGGKAHSSNVQVGVSGGNSDVQYLISGDFRNMTNLQRYAGGNDQTSSLHFNLSTGNSNSAFSMNFSGSYTYNKNTIPPADLIGSIFSLAPDSPPLFNPNGTLNYENNTFQNPLTATRLKANTSVNNLISSLLLNYRIMKGLNFQTTLGFNRQSLDEFLGTPTTSIPPSQLASGLKASSRFTYDNKWYWSVEPLLNYIRPISKGTLSVTAGWSLQKQYSDAKLFQANGYASDLLLENIAGGTSITPFAGGYSANLYKYNAVFGRANYNWEDKYILNFSGRYDGSSRFGENRKFHFFPAAGFAWLFSSEKFMQDHVPAISFGKIRFSYGLTGNDQIGAYNYLTNYALVGGTAYQGVPGVTPNNLPNPNLSWETVAKTNIGLEMQFLKGRIGIEGNFYRNITTGLILASPLASTGGFQSININQDGKVINKGFDISLNTQNIRNENFSWSTTILYTRQRNKLAAYPNVPPAQQFRLNQSVGTVNVYRYAGVNKETGIYQFYDKDGKVVSTPTQGDDQVDLVDLTPDYFGSVSNTVSYKGFSLSFMFRYVKQQGASVRGIFASSLFPGFANGNIPVEMLDRWQKPGDEATYQKYSTGFQTLLAQFNINRLADVFYGDASYVRLQNASLGYQFPSNFAQKVHLKNFRMYLNGENLATISRYGVLDPENQSNSRVGPLRTIVLGLQATF